MYIGTCEIGCNCTFCLAEAAETAKIQQMMLGPDKPDDLPVGFEDNEDEFTPAADTEDY